MNILKIPQDECWFVDWEKRVISGFTAPGKRRVKPGAEVQCDMQSGQVARFTVKKVEYLPQPANQYVGWVEDLAYET